MCAFIVAFLFGPA